MEESVAGADGAPHTAIAVTGASGAAIWQLTVPVVMLAPTGRATVRPTA
jgi:hypothetical protein